MRLLTPLERSQTIRWIYSVSPLLLVLVALVACGPTKKAGSYALSDCELRLENRAGVEVARRAFNAGQLGTADQLASNSYFKGLKRSTFLDSDGHLLPYDQLMATATSYQVLGWVNTLEGKVGDRVHAAKMHARATSTCKHKTTS
jgi:hypothetical protein